MPQNVVPSIAMDNTPIAGLQELEDHLDKLIAEPDTPHEPKLFDNVELYLTETNIPPLLPTWLPKLTTILQTTQQDPKTVVSLVVKLLSPVPFAQTLILADEAALVSLLQSPAPSANILAMTIIHKAAANASDAARLADMSQVLEWFIRCWLSAPQVEVGEKGSRVLGDLLEVDSDIPPLREVRHAVTVDGIAWMNGATNGSANGVSGSHQATGTGRLWQRFTQDSTLGTLLVSIPQGEDPILGILSQHQATLAQGRLLRLLPRLAAQNFDGVAQALSTGASGGQAESLLHFVAVRMVDKKDMLMHLSLVDFFEALLSLMRIRLDQGGGDRNSILTTLKQTVAEATTDDNVLKAALLSLHERTVPEEAEGLKAFVDQVVN